MTKRHVLDAAGNAMPYTTPTEVAEATFEAVRARRQPMRNGVPDPRAAWKPTVDHNTLAAMLRRMLADDLAAAGPETTRRDVAQILLDNIDERFPPADMAVLKRYGMTSPYSTVHVGAEAVRLPVTRELPAPQARLYPVQFTMAPISAHDRAAPTPAAARFMFEAIDAARRTIEQERLDGNMIPARLRGQLGRQPTWREIGVAMPRLGEWMARQRAA
ncbi:hypothetical protein [Sphingomonas sp.]|uniref:hypothetical protein n=1 Tax=Sphingomonas sp. TaxID=28214 RepID=UPI003B002C2D